MLESIIYLGGLIIAIIAFIVKNRKNDSDSNDNHFYDNEDDFYNNLN